MRILSLLAAALTLAACSSSFNYPSGKRAATVRSNVTQFSFEGGGITVKANRIDNATPTHEAFAGITDFGATVASGAFAYGAPAFVNGATRAAVLLAPHVTARIPRATPRPIPFTPIGSP